jgi:hypothetical protein
MIAIGVVAGSAVSVEALRGVGAAAVIDDLDALAAVIGELGRGEAG